MELMQKANWIALFGLNSNMKKKSVTFIFYCKKIRHSKDRCMMVVDNKIKGWNNSLHLGP